MRVANGTSGRVEIIPGEDDSAELLAIAGTYMPEWLRLFAKKNSDYGSGSAFELGERGQYSDIHRKMIKLKRAMWDGEELDFEGVDEIIHDLIGHLFLTLHMRSMKEEANRVYAYNEDDAAVETVFHLVGHDASKAYQMSYGLNPPFGEMVRERASKQMEDEARQEMIRQGVDPSISLEAAAQRLRDAGMTNERDEPLLATRGQLHRFGGEEFGEADQEQHSKILGPMLSVQEAVMDRPLRDDDPAHPQAPDDEDGDLLNRLGEMVDGVTDEMLKGEAKEILDKLFKNSTKQHELLSRFERKIRGY